MIGSSEPFDVIFKRVMEAMLGLPLLERRRLSVRAFGVCETIGSLATSEIAEALPLQLPVDHRGSFRSDCDVMEVASSFFGPSVALRAGLSGTLERFVLGFCADLSASLGGPLALCLAMVYMKH